MSNVYFQALKYTLFTLLNCQYNIDSLYPLGIITLQ